MVAQAAGALNDNVFKVVIMLLIAGGVAENARSAYLSAVQALFVLPYILFSSYAGFLADRFSKTFVMRAAKGAEVLIALVAFALLLRHNLVWLMFLFFLLGTHSAFFSPAKYGSMPELLDDRHLSRGNGYLEFGTFLAIIIGTALGGLLKWFGGENLVVAASVILAVACLGFAASLAVQKLPPANPSGRIDWNPGREILRTLSEISKVRPLFLALLAISYFWFFGSFYQMNTMRYAPELLGAGELGTSLLLCALAVGIGTGSIVAGKTSEHKVEVGLIPIGAFGLALFTLLLYGTRTSYAGSMAVFILGGVSAGFYIVPLNAYFQHEAPVNSRGRYLAALNVVSFAAILFSALLFWLLTAQLKLTPAEAFLVVGIGTFFGAIYVTRTLPHALLRCINWILSRCFYSLQVYGDEFVPQSGGALIVCNHVSFADPSLVMAGLERPVRFLMDRTLYASKLLNPIARVMRAIPISSSDHPKEIVAALREARDAVERGELVCIFAEGAITRIGRLLPFSKGLEKIIKGLNAPIIPAYLDELWGSVFSYEEGRFFWKLPKEVPYPVSLSFGKPLPSSVKTWEVRQAIQELSAGAFQYRRRRHQLLHVGFTAQARRTPFRRCVADTTGRSLRYCQALAVALVAQRLVKRSTDRGDKVGLWLPASVGGALANVAVLMAGRVPVNLNFTASKDGVASAILQCGIKQVLSSRAFREKMPFEHDTEVVYLEDIRARIRWWERALCFIPAFLFPVSFIERLFFPRDVKRDDLATIIFSSGSTGEPKGVMLTHANIASNLESLYELIQFRSDDGVAGVLPFFHSFGFTATIWLPLLGGMRAVYHPNPTDAQTVGEIVQQNQLTLLMSTPTFLQIYTRKIAPEAFASLRYVIVGAEKLREQIAQAFHERFAITPLEGYGTTELSPVAMTNIPDFEHRGVRQVGQKQGTVGHPIPGVAARIVDPESGALLPPGSDGLLLIRGPNVMRGYLQNDALTKEVIRDGWYVTGDIASMDEDGFVRITGRLSRFSKIGGEMVPHVKVEDEIHRFLGANELVCVVTAVPDEKKGERLVVLSTIELNVPEIISGLGAAGLPNLWIPKAENFFRIEAIPVLGSGKLDLRAIREAARSLVKNG